MFLERARRAREGEGDVEGYYFGGDRYGGSQGAGVVVVAASTCLVVSFLFFRLCIGRGADVDAFVGCGCVECVRDVLDPPCDGRR